MQKEIQTTKLTRIGLWLALGGLLVLLLKGANDSLCAASPSYNYTFHELLESPWISIPYSVLEVIACLLIGLGAAFAATIRPGWVRFAFCLLPAPFLFFAVIKVYSLITGVGYFSVIHQNGLKWVQNGSVAVYVSALILFVFVGLFYTRKAARVFAFLSGFFWVWFGFANIFILLSSDYIINVAISLFGVLASIATVIFVIILATSKKYRKAENLEADEGEMAEA